MVNGNKIQIGRYMKVLEFINIKGGYCLALFILIFVGCKKDQHVKPVPGDFEVVSEIPLAISSSGGTFTLTIDGTTNGWWVEVTNNASWVTIPRKYGSSKVSQQIKIASNTSNADRESEIMIHSTGGQKEVIKINQTK